MKILSIRMGFTSDHSSTSYEFLSVDKALSRKERAEVSSLSRRVDPTSRRVSFIYHVDGYDIPGGWDELMEKYYDVMYRESYDWWTFAIAFNATKEQIEDLSRYEFSGEDDLGVVVCGYGDRVVVSIHCRVDVAFFGDYYDEYEEYYDDQEDGDSEKVDFVAEDKLLNLLIQVRRQLINRDYRTLYAVWEKYGSPDGDDEDNYDYEIPAPPQKSSGRDIVEQFKNILDK